MVSSRMFLYNFVNHSDICQLHPVFTCFPAFHALPPLPGIALVY